MTNASAQRGRGRPPGSRIEPQQRRAELLDAAERSLRSRGPDLSLVDVAREAGLSRSAVYAAFPDKEALVAALAQRQARRIIDEVAAVVGAAGDPRAQTRAAVECLCRWVDEDPHVSAALGESMRAPAVFDVLAQWLESVLALGFDQLGGDVRAAGPWARAVLGAVSTAVRWWARERTMSRDELVDHVTSLVWSGFAGAGGSTLRLPLPVNSPDGG